MRDNNPHRKGVSSCRIYDIDEVGKALMGQKLMCKLFFLDRARQNLETSAGITTSHILLCTFARRRVST